MSWTFSSIDFITDEGVLRFTSSKPQNDYWSTVCQKRKAIGFEYNLLKLFQQRLNALLEICLI